MKDAYLEKLYGKQIRPYVVDSAGKVPIDHANVAKDAGYYVGSKLQAKKDVPVYTDPSGNILMKVIRPGGYVGSIYSWVTRNGIVWWQLNEGGFVENRPGAFSQDLVESTASGAEHEELLEELESEPADKVLQGVSDIGSGIGSTLSGLGKSLPLILLGAVLLILTIGFLGAKKQGVI